MALWSGSVCKVSEEDLYSIYTSDRDLRNVGFWDFGAEDGSIPVDLSIDNLQRLVRCLNLEPVQAAVFLSW